MLDQPGPESPPEALEMQEEAYVERTSAIIIWQSKVPLPNAEFGRLTWERILVTTGAPKVMLGTKWPSMISICSQSAPCVMVVEHALPRAPKSADKIEGAMIAAGDMTTVDRHTNGIRYAQGFKH